jgi:DUF1680 family protein
MNGLFGRDFAEMGGPIATCLELAGLIELPQSMCPKFIPPYGEVIAMLKNCTFVIVCLAIPGVLNAGDKDARPKVEVKRMERPMAPGDVSGISGFIGTRLRANTEGYLRLFDIDHYVRMVEQKEHREWWWIGEQPGKWLESTALAAEQSGDEALREKAAKVLARLVAAQEPGGYLGITDPAVRTDRLPLRGMDAYELYFMLHGLLTAHELWDDDAALQAAQRLGDYFVDKIGPGKAEFRPGPKGQTIAGHDIHYSLEGTLLADPVLRLYLVTGHEKYLKWSRWVIENIDRWSGHNTFSKLDQVADGTMGVHELQPRVHCHTFHMNLLGLLRLYEITGDSSLLRKVRGAWRDIAGRQMYITGGVSVDEYYQPGRNLPATGSVVETCAMMSWMEASQYLLELTADPSYADAIERLLWNHWFAAQTSDGDIFRYHTPLNGGKPGGYFHEPDCCTASGPRMTSKIPLLIYAVAEDGLYVNQFVDSAAEIGLKSGNVVSVRQQTDYPSGEKIVIRVEPRKAERFTLHVRLPAWCRGPLLSVNGQAVGVLKPGTYAKIDRRWKKADRVTLSLPMRARWVRRSHTTKDSWALTRGPVVYAVDTVLWERPALKSLGADIPKDLSRLIGVVIDESDPSAGVRPAAVPAGTLGPAYRVKIAFPDGEQTDVTALPFANVGRWYADADNKPDRDERRYAYAVWLHNVGSPQYSETMRQYHAKKQLLARTVDAVRPGNTGSERAHTVKGENTNTGRHHGERWRQAGDGGWFSYEMAVLAEEPMTLLCTWWGDEKRFRTFDILIDDERIATQTLMRNKPGEFFDVKYDIPPALTAGKRKVVVRFQAHPGNTAGGLYGCAILKPPRLHVEDKNGDSKL